MFILFDSFKTMISFSKQKQADAYKDQMSLLKQRNIELENDMQFCRKRESELLLFTQQLTDKNVRLQSEFTAMETKVIKSL